MGGGTVTTKRGAQRACLTARAPHLRACGLVSATQPGDGFISGAQPFGLRPTYLWHMAHASRMAELRPWLSRRPARPTGRDRDALRVSCLVEVVLWSCAGCVQRDIRSSC